MKQRVVDSSLINQLTKINDHRNLLGLANSHRNFGRPPLKKIAFGQTGSKAQLRDSATSQGSNNESATNVQDNN